MPFENLPVAPTKIAIIGGGVSGLGAAYLLSRSHDVTLFESEGRLGGHARTVIAGKNNDQPVDTGFIVFNYANYPRLTKLFEELNVPVEKSNMSFGVSANNGQVEYALNSIKAMFAQNRNLINPAFYKMLRDIVRFNARAADMVKSREMTLGELINVMRLGDWFRDYYLLPFSGAIWSTPLKDMMDFPAEALIRFFENHNLLGYHGHHQWYTVSGGSIEYVKRLTANIEAQNTKIRVNAPVMSVRRDEKGVLVRAKGGAWERFDRVVFACHSDEALQMLEAPTADEQRLLGAIGYQDNHAVLHCDASVMPRRKQCWASWVYSTKEVNRNASIGVTYWMNLLQNINHDDLLLETLNPSHDIKDELIYSEKSFRHPVFDKNALEAQPQIQAIQGQNNTWFCGAYMRNGFHEDGFSSGVDVAEHMDGVGVWA